MNKIVRNIGFVILAVSAASATVLANQAKEKAPAKHETTAQDTQQWYVDGEGNPIAPVEGVSRCQNLTLDLCSAEFNMDGDIPTTNTHQNDEYAPFL